MATVLQERRRRSDGHQGGRRFYPKEILDPKMGPGPTPFGGHSGFLLATTLGCFYQENRPQRRRSLLWKLNWLLVKNGQAIKLV